MAIIFERNGPVATITLNRPEKMNALDPATYEEITQAFADIERDRDILVGIITGAGDRAFTAGADLKLMHTGDESGGGGGGEWAPWRPDRWDFGLTTSKPLIAAVNGYALAGGLELALICDIRIASPNAIFGTPEVKWNLLHGFGAYRLPRIISLSHAMEMLLTGEFIDAETALRIGLISRIVPADELLSEAARMAGGPVVEDRRIGTGRVREIVRALGIRIVGGKRDQPRRATGAEKVRDIELAFARLPAEFGRQIIGIGLGEGPGHDRVGGRIVAQLENLGAHRRIAHLVMAVRGLGDGVGIAAIAELGTGLLDGAEPGLLDELKQPARRGRRGAGLRVQSGLDLRRRQ